MGKKTVNELCIEMEDLKKKHENEVNNLKMKHDELRQAFDILSKKYDKVESEHFVKDAGRKCEVCGESFSNARDLGNHMKKHRSVGTIKCNKCERMFDEEWKMTAHLKTHIICNICEKTFKYQDILEKHIKIAHENAKLYCHFYNNDKNCPFNLNCIFLHEDSSQCRYGKLCERTYCMFKHEEVEEKDEEPVDISILFEESEIPDAEKTFFNPYRRSEKLHENENIVTVETVIVHTEVEEFKCELCVFKTTDKARFTKHQKEIHSLKGKYFCSNCERPFDNRKEFNGHKYHGCGT